MCVLGDFHIHQKYWLPYSGKIDRPCELCCNFSIWNDLTQMVKFLTWIPDFDSHSPALLHLFISSGASICFTMTFFSLGNSDYVAVSVSIDFPSNLKVDPPFHCIAYQYSHAHWIGIVFVIMWEMSHERISLNSVLLLLLVNFFFGWCNVQNEWVQNWCIHPSTKILRSALLISIAFSCLYCWHTS